MVRRKKYLIFMCIIVFAVLPMVMWAGVRVNKSKENPYVKNVFDEMIWEGFEILEEAEILKVGGYDAVRLSYPVKEGTPLTIGIIYSMEYKKLYIYGDACMPENMGDMSYQAYFEKCLKDNGITWEEVEDCKETFICKEVLGKWFEEEKSEYSKDRLGEVEVLDYLMPYEYCGKDSDEWKTVTEKIEEGYKGLFEDKVETIIWHGAYHFPYAQTQQSRDYGYHDIIGRIEADMNGFNTISEKIVVEWREKEDGVYNDDYDSLTGLISVIIDLGDFAAWMKTSGKVNGYLTKLSYTREEGAVKTQEILEHYPIRELRYILIDADFYIEGSKLHIRIPYYDYEAEEPGWMQNGEGEIWQGWVTVQLEDIRDFTYKKFW